MKKNIETIAEIEIITTEKRLRDFRMKVTFSDESSFLLNASLKKSTPFPQALGMCFFRLKKEHNNENLNELIDSINANKTILHLKKLENISDKPEYTHPVIKFVYHVHEDSLDTQSKEFYIKGVPYLFIKK